MFALENKGKGGGGGEGGGRLETGRGTGKSMRILVRRFTQHMDLRERSGVTCVNLHFRSVGVTCVNLCLTTPEHPKSESDKKSCLTIVCQTPGCLVDLSDSFV